MYFIVFLMVILNCEAIVIIFTVLGILVNCYNLQENRKFDTQWCDILKLRFDDITYKWTLF